jgi:hypothetical protein
MRGFVGDWGETYNNDKSFLSLFLKLLVRYVEIKLQVRDVEKKASCLRCGSFEGDWGETDDNDKSFLSLF